MALQFVGYTSGDGTGSSYSVSLTNLSGGIGSAPQAGDIVIVCAAHAGTTNSAPTCSGNNNGAYSGLGAAAYANSTYDTNMRGFYKVMGATPDTQLTIGRTSSTAYGGGTVLQVWRNPSGAPIQVTGTPTTVTNGSRGNMPSVTPTTDGTQVIGFGAGAQGASGTSITFPAELTDNRIFLNTNGTTSDICVLMASAPGTNGVAFDPSAWTGGMTSSFCSAAAQTIVLAPAGPPGSNPTLRQSYGTALSESQADVVMQTGDVVLVFYSDTGGLDVASCSDTLGNSYVEIESPGFACTPSSVHAHTFKAVVTNPGTATITVANQGAYIPTILVHVVQDSDGTLVASYKAESTAGTAHSTNSISAPDNAYLATFWFQDYASSRTLTDGSEFTQRQQASSDGSTVYQYSYDKIGGAAGSVSQSVTGNGNCIYGSLILALSPAASSGVTGTSTASAGTLGGSASGSHGVTGSTNKAVGTLAGSATGIHAQPIVATSLAALILAGSIVGAHGVSGSSTSTIGTLGGSASGIAAVVGSSSQAMGTLGGLAAGGHGVAGTSAAPVGIMGGNASGSHTPPTYTGTSTAAIGALSGQASGAHGVSGTSSKNIGTFAGTVTGAHGVSGTSTAGFTLGGSAAGVHAQPITGTSNVNVATFAGSATGAHGVAGTSSALVGTLGGSATGGTIMPVSGTSSASIGPLGGSAAGTHTPPTFIGTSTASIGTLGGQIVATFTLPSYTGSSNAPLGVLAGSITAAHGVAATSTEPVGTLGGSITAIHAAPVVGTSNASIGPLAGQITGNHYPEGVYGSSTASIGALAGSMAGAHGVSGTSSAGLFPPAVPLRPRYGQLWPRPAVWGASPATTQGRVKGASFVSIGRIGGEIVGTYSLPSNTGTSVTSIGKLGGQIVGFVPARITATSVAQVGRLGGQIVGYTPQRFIGVSSASIGRLGGQVVGYVQRKITGTSTAPIGRLGGQITGAVGSVPSGVQVNLTPSAATAVAAGGTLQFGATVTGSGNTAVTWKVDGITGGNSTVGTITTGGLYTAPTGASRPALRTISATANADGSTQGILRIVTAIGSTLVNGKTGYGAAGNGITDDTSVIANAMAAAGNGICLLPSGRYLVNPNTTANQFAVNVPTGLTLLLAAGAELVTKTFTQTGGYGTVRMAGNNCAIVGGTITGDRAARDLPDYDGDVGVDYETGQGIEFKAGAYQIALGVTSREHCCDGFYLSSDVNNLEIYDCVADHNRRQGLSLVYCHDVTIRYSTFKNTQGNDPGCGMDFEPNTGSTVRNVLVQYCSFLDNAGGGIAGGPAYSNGPDGNDSAHCYDCTIDNCLFERNGGANYHLGGLAWDASQRITLTDLVFNDNLGHAIKVFYSFTDGLLSGNIGSGNDGYGIVLGDGPVNDCAGTVCTNNPVTGTSGHIHNDSNSGVSNPT